jgi:hypothetical protein
MTPRSLRALVLPLSISALAFSACSSGEPARADDASTDDGTAGSTASSAAGHATSGASGASSHVAAGAGGSSGKGGASSGVGGGSGASGKTGVGGSGVGGASGTGGSAGKSTSTGGGAGGAAGAGGSDDATAVWNQASLTTFTSYPAPGNDECVKYNGCMWEGQFAGIDGIQTEAWVMAHNLVAVHSKDFAKYKLKTLRIRKGGKQIDAVVYDECADSDCSGCCTQNAKPSGNLIDMEKYTVDRFGASPDGQVEWRCLDCN